MHGWTEMSKIKTEQKSLKLYPGISIRTRKTVQTIQIQFTLISPTHGKIHIREPYKGEVNQKNIDAASLKRSDILSLYQRRALDFNASDYQSIFKDSHNIKYFGEKPLPTKTITMSKILQDFYYTCKGRQDNGTLKESTAVGYFKILTAMNNEFGRISTKDFNSIVIKNWLDSQGGAIKTLRNKLSILNKALIQATGLGYFQKSPLDYEAFSDMIKGAADTISEYKVEPFSPNEIAEIISKIQPKQEQFLNFVMFSLWTGARTSEAICLTWDDIDFEKGTISINKAKVCEVLNYSTKTAAGMRNIVILPEALKALNRQKKFTFGKGKLVFLKPNGGEYKDSSQAGDSWRRYVKKTNVPYRNLYQLRHTYATTLLEAGEDEGLVFKQLGHKTSETLNRVYKSYIKKNTKSEFIIKGDYSTPMTPDDLP